MECRGRLLFDLNEPPTEEEGGIDQILRSQPQKSEPTHFHISNLLIQSKGAQGMVNNYAFRHAVLTSVFQPFVRSKDMKNSNELVAQMADASSFSPPSSSMPVKPREYNRFAPSVVCGSTDVETVEKKEECTEMVHNTDAVDRIHGNKHDEVNIETLQENGEGEDIEISCAKPSQNDVHGSSSHGSVKVGMSNATKDVHVQCGLNTSEISESSCKKDIPIDSIEEPPLAMKPRHALRLPNNLGKRHKIDEQKEAMLGKRRGRQTVFIPVVDAKQGFNITSIPKRQASIATPVVNHTLKEACHTSPGPADEAWENQSYVMPKQHKQSDASNSEEFRDRKANSNSNIDLGLETSLKKMDSSEFSNEVPQRIPSIPRHGSWKQPVDSKESKNSQSQVLSRKATTIGENLADTRTELTKLPPPRRQSSSNPQYQDSSVEKLLREVTNDKFWHHPEETDLQCVPGSFESVEEYVRVFEPLLLEECRAQLHNTWEELTETTSNGVHISVRLRAVERRERGWYDAIVLPLHEFKWTFKEGDVAVLSSYKPGSARARRNINVSSAEGVKSEVDLQVVGTVRRYLPVNTRDPTGAILHFFVGASHDSSSQVDGDYLFRNLQPKSLWYLTVLGSLTTTQREYFALHAFHHLNLQMQSAILRPSPEHFPNYEEQSPAMPECFTQSFVDYLHKTFNEPQLAAIQWAAMHTAAGTSSGAAKRQEPWPFTLVQGPPGTGKTHTVWGMLNVIHLVQYQRYYTVLLKKLAPDSYKQASESSSQAICTGLIDELLQNMDQNLFRTLPKLCPKPRMLVCAPSNAATDELLARVLDRGFMDGEMKVYRPDVARVGVDSQNHAAQAVSVERRTEQLLLKSRDEIVGWMHQLKAHEVQFSQQIAALQRELNAVAAAARSQGSVGVDPDVFIARDHHRDVLLQNLAAALEGKDKVLVEMSRLLILDGRFRSASSFNLEDARANLEASFANEAEIVFTTVSSSGRRIFSRLTHGFDMVVIDEAAQASEVAVLPPLSLGAARCVLVGDPQQLPATVISKAAGTLLYNRSLFERFQQAGCATMLLSVQYRMHPQIRDFPSRHFYQGRLTDSDSVANLPDEAYYKDPLLQPYIFYDVVHGRESHRDGSVSYQNIHEAQFCLRLYEHLQTFLKNNGGKKVSVGIVTPYKLQLKCLRREFDEVLNSEEGKELYINTVDAFQGQERDVIIMSCVRASSHGVGFVADIRRMNVALTRAKRALWVVGNANALIQSEDWASLIKDAESRKCFMDMGCIPKDFLIAKGCAQNPGDNNIKNLRSGRQRPHIEMIPESKLGTLSEVEDKSNAYPSRNCSYRSKQIENSNR